MKKDIVQPPLKSFLALEPGWTQTDALWAKNARHLAVVNANASCLIMNVYVILLEVHI